MRFDISIVDNDLGKIVGIDTIRDITGVMSELRSAVRFYALSDISRVDRENGVIVGDDGGVDHPSRHGERGIVGSGDGLEEMSARDTYLRIVGGKEIIIDNAIVDVRLRSVL